MPNTRHLPLHLDPGLYARYGLDPRADGTVLRSLTAFAEHKRWPPHKLDELLAWERAVRPLGLSPQDYRRRALTDLGAAGWSERDLDALDAWHDGVARHGPAKAWPLGPGESSPHKEADMELTEQQRARKHSIETMMRRDRRAYFADQAVQDEYRALVEADAAPVRRVAADADTDKFTRDVRRYMRTNRDDYFRDERLQSTYRAVLAQDTAHAEQSGSNAASEPGAD